MSGYVRSRSTGRGARQCKQTNNCTCSARIVQSGAHVQQVSRLDLPSRPLRLECSWPPGQRANNGDGACSPRLKRARERAIEAEVDVTSRQVEIANLSARLAVRDVSTCGRSNLQVAALARALVAPTPTPPQQTLFKEIDDKLARGQQICVVAALSARRFVGHTKRSTHKRKPPRHFAALAPSLRQGK